MRRNIVFRQRARTASHALRHPWNSLQQLWRGRRSEDPVVPFELPNDNAADPARERVAAWVSDGQLTPVRTRRENRRDLPNVPYFY